MTAAREGRELVARVLEARSRYGAGTIPLLRRGLELTWGRGFDAGEAFDLGLFDPSLSPEALKGFASKAETMALQRELNPSRWSDLTRNKHIFYNRCEAEGLPVPRLIAVFVTDATGWTAGGDPLRSRDDWAGFFERRVADDFVIKPVSGYHGESVRVVRRTDGGFSVAGGRRLAPGELFDEMRGDRFDEFLVQERLWNHPTLADLAGTDVLQTARVTSLVDGDGRVGILQALWKTAVGGGGTDNYRGGASGNLLVPVEPEGGTLGPAATAEPGGGGIRWLRRHPETGATLEGTRLPFWDDARSLVRRAAGHFLPLRTIGWDVALTPDGPVLVEGNLWWDPPNPLGTMGPVMAALEETVASEAEERARGRRAGR